ncbi:MAG: hypothetical protein Q4G43_14245 [Mobilicoccus sp.]|nr:hypothetical protein [Mobilicoccus sp.]
MSGEPRGVEDEARALAEAISRARGGSRPLHVVPAVENDLGCAACGGEVEGSACTVCPVCRGVSWVREHGPEALRSLADAAGLLAEGLRVLATQVEGLGQATEDGAEDDEHASGTDTKERS